MEQSSLSSLARMIDRKKKKIKEINTSSWIPVEDPTAYKNFFSARFHLSDRDLIGREMSPYLSLSFPATFAKPLLPSLRKPKEGGLIEQSSNSKPTHTRKLYCKWNPPTKLLTSYTYSRASPEASILSVPRKPKIIVDVSRRVRSNRGERLLGPKIWTFCSRL